MERNPRRAGRRLGVYAAARERLRAVVIHRTNCRFGHVALRRCAPAGQNFGRKLHTGMRPRERDATRNSRPEITANYRCYYYYCCYNRRAVTTILIIIIIIIIIAFIRDTFRTRQLYRRNGVPTDVTTARVHNYWRALARPINQRAPLVFNC